ncbi:signal transduction histidine kinase [Tuber brumale]|nr:signal transduction histidine kinase [Tuber brumale]
MLSLKMPSKKDTSTATAKETTAVEASQGYPSDRTLLDSNETPEFIDLGTFDQILEMDDDDDREFSKAIVWGFMDQAEDTFRKMGVLILKTEKLHEKLHELSSLGHFLKGSSATLGLTTVKDYCERIQNLGSGLDEAGAASTDDDEVRLTKIKTALDGMKKEYARVRVYFTRIYDHPPENSQS